MPNESRLTTDQPWPLGLGELADDLDRLLAVPDAEREAAYPGDRRGRQPVHTAYIPADKFWAGSVRQWGEAALAAMAEHVPGPEALAKVMGLDEGVAAEVHDLVLAKLAREPVEDLRIDFEDGYGTRDDATEDADAEAAARALVATDPPPPFRGLRCKSLERPVRRRALRTIAVFFGALPDGARPPLITLPKVTSAAQVAAMALVCERLDAEFEIQVETPQVICGPDGAATVARCIEAARGRLTGLHYGTYDYSAALGIAPQQQRLDHPAADHARAVMQVAAAGTGVRLSDGSSNVLPAGDRDDVLAAWRLHASLVLRSLERGFYQGWDLHPAQLVSRYAATYAFYRDGLPSACDRLRTLAERARSGQEEPATARALAGYVLRALDCGAATDQEVRDRCGLDLATLRAAPRW